MEMEKQYVMFMPISSCDVTMIVLSKKRIFHVDNFSRAFRENCHI